MEFYAAVRLAVVDEGLSHHEAGRRFGIDRRTVKKVLSYSAPPEYRRTKPVRRRKLDGFTGVIDAILEADRAQPCKQRHTAQDASVHASAIALPVPRPLRTARQGQRQGQGRGPGEDGAAPVHGADPEGARAGRFERAAAGALPGASRGAEARGTILRRFVEWAPRGGQFQADDLTGLRDCPSSKRLGLR